MFYCFTSLFVFFVYLFTDISADEERDKSLAYIVRNEIFTLFDLIWPQFLCKFVGTAADTVQTKSPFILNSSIS